MKKDVDSNIGTKMLKINPFILIIASFVIIILVGALLLAMPWSNVYNSWLFNFKAPDGQNLTFIDCLFTATSATCVTGISTYRSGFSNSLTFGGQFVTLCMIIIGGLGIITILTFLITLFSGKLEFKQRLFISVLISANSMSDVVHFVRKLIIIQAISILIGTGLGIPVFITIFPNNIFEAIWNSLFHAVSAFNNAGFDLLSNSFIGGIASPSSNIIIGNDSWLYYYFCTYIMLLIVTGGISFLVIISAFSKKQRIKLGTTFPKAVLLTSGVLILLGTIFFIITDGFKKENPMTVFDALFQSITCRTAGFSTYLPDDISIPGKVVSCILMFIGGAPLSTAGGIKVTTIFIIFLSMKCYFQGRKVHAFKRAFSTQTVLKSMSVAFVAINIIIVSFIITSAFGFENGMSYSEVQARATIDTANKIDTDYTLGMIFEIFSCFGTVGFALGFESYFSIGTKVTLCILMLLGRLGPMTFFQIFSKNMDKKDNSHYRLVKEEFIIS